MIKLKLASTVSDSESVKNPDKKVRIISDLASYFRVYSRPIELSEDSPTSVQQGEKVIIQNMLMYAVLVGQSLILFIAYIKRLFYVIILAMLAPIVVVIDFFQKF